MPEQFVPHSVPRSVRSGTLIDLPLCLTAVFVFYVWLKSYQRLASRFQFRVSTGRAHVSTMRVSAGIRAMQNPSQSASWGVLLLVLGGNARPMTIQITNDI